MSRAKPEHGFTHSGRSAEHGFTSLRRSAEHGFTSLRCSAEHGFTLIEMLVALAVFSLAALALLRLEGTMASNSFVLQDRLIGQIVARNVAVATLTDPEPPSFGSASGEEQNAGRAWRWTRTASRAPDPDLQRIDIVVRDDHGLPAGALIVFRAVPI